MSDLIRRRGPFAYRNARLFVLFSVFYNARAYYPVLAVLFIDLGLTLEQYVMLNAVWAGAIFLLEVPSGALADTIGRKRLLVFSAALMVAEMGVLLLAPKDGGWWLFAMCLVNRLLSGTSEAAASGADEAIAYDSLPEDGRSQAWDEVLATVMRWRSVGFLIAMTAGGLLYDPSWWNGMVSETFHVSTDIARRLPVVLVLLQGLACLMLALRFDEARSNVPATAGACRAALRLTLQTARYALTTRSIAIVLMGGLLIDMVARNFATLVSEYYRLVELPGWSFGMVGSLIAVGNWFVPSVATRINQRFNTTTSLLIGGVMALLGLFALVPAWPWFGLIPAMLLMWLLGFTGFTVGRFLHGAASSDQRATMLSVKGLLFNLGYGAGSMAFAMLIAGVGKQGGGALQQALLWQAWFFAFGLLVFGIVSRRVPKSAD